MNKPIEFFFDFISPFGWFAAERIGGIVSAHGRNVAWKPLLLGVTVKQAMGLPAVLQTPLKGTMDEAGQMAIDFAMLPELLKWAGSQDECPPYNRDTMTPPEPARRALR